MLLAHLLHSVIEGGWKVLVVNNHHQTFNRANYVLSEKKYGKEDIPQFG